MSERQNEKIINLMQTDDSADAPTDARIWAKNLFRSRAAAPQKSLARKILAVLQMDLSSHRAAFGERSASASAARQMFFRAGENALDLRLTAAENGCGVRGQILGDGFSDAVVSVGDFETRVDGTGEFAFVEIPFGTYDLRVRGGENEIVIENFELKQF